MLRRKYIRKRGATAIHPVQRGQSLVELALSLVFLIFLVAGIIDIGRAILTLIAMRDAVQEGVIYGSLHPLENGKRNADGSCDTNCLVEDHVRNSGNQTFLRDYTNTQIDVTLINGTCMDKDDIPPATISVTMVHTFHFSMPFFSSATIPLTATAIGVILNAC